MVLVNHVLITQDQMMRLKNVFLMIVENYISYSNQVFVDPVQNIRDNWQMENNVDQILVE